MLRIWRALILVAALLMPQSAVFAWHDTGHMVVAQIAYMRLTPAARRHVDRLLVTLPDKRPLLFYCDKTYDPISIAVWMDDIKGDSLNDAYAPWHYINYKPLFDGVPVRGDVGPEPANVLDRLNWIINTMRKGTGRDKTDAELLGFLFHLVGDVHQPLHTTTRYSVKNPDGDAGGNGFAVLMRPETRIRNLHSYWDGAAGLFDFQNVPRPLDASGQARIRAFADQLMKAYPAEAHAEWKQIEPQLWVEESNKLAREFAYVRTKEGEAPSKAYTEEARKISGRRIALAGYRLAEVLNTIYTEQPAPQK